MENWLLMQTFYHGFTNSTREDRANEKQEVMQIQDSRMTCEECGNTGHLGNNYPETHEDVNFINNNNYCPDRIKDGISNKGQITKVTNKVIISITNHLLKICLWSG